MYAPDRPAKRPPNSVRGERAFCERLNYDLLFKWFLDLLIDAQAFDPTPFTENGRLLPMRSPRARLAANREAAALPGACGVPRWSTVGMCSCGFRLVIRTDRCRPHAFPVPGTRRCHSRGCCLVL
jgi:hypothetical protein